MKSILVIVVILEIIFNSPNISLSVLYGFDVWYKSLFPSIFVSLMLVDLLISSKIISLLVKLFGDIFYKLFKINKYGVIVFFVSLLAGTPTNIAVIMVLLKKSLINYYDVNKLIPLCLLFNPVFVINNTSLKIYLIVLISSIISGIILSNYKYEVINIKEFKIDKYNFSKSIEKNIHTLLNILGIVVTFMVLVNFITLKKPIVKVLVSSILELTTGLINTNIYFKNNNILYLFILSFGGLSIFFQIKSILNDIKINYIYFLKYRLLVFIISIFICSIT